MNQDCPWKFTSVLWVQELAETSDPADYPGADPDQYWSWLNPARSRLTIKSLTAVYMDPAILKLVLSNVISNAVKHSDAGGEIQPVSKKKGRTWRLENTSQKW